MLKSLVPLCNRVILTSPKIDRALAPEKLYTIVKEIITDIHIIPDVDKAITYAIETATTNDVICIAGSLYVVGEANSHTTCMLRFFTVSRSRRRDFAKLNLRPEH
jgi:dihydrofolate synthase/folylpolyglutamate synthase